MKLHLGCGRLHLEGWVNCDLYPGPNVDAAFDVQKDWPFDDSTATEIYASHMLEHLADPHAFFREAWRVLIPNGSMLLRTPYGGHKAAWWDLTHLRPWYPETFCFLQPGYAAAVHNPQSDDWRAYFGVANIDMRVSAKFRRILRHALGRRLLMPWADHLGNFVEELWAYLFALKTDAAVREYAATRPGNYVPGRYVIYRHQLEGRPTTAPDEPTELVPLVDTEEVNGFHGWPGWRWLLWR